jgi:hypothetical protein
MVLKAKPTALEGSSLFSGRPIENVATMMATAWEYKVGSLQTALICLNKPIFILKTAEEMIKASTTSTIPEPTL